MSRTFKSARQPEAEARAKK
jgi:hypothetical protein